MSPVASRTKNVSPEHIRVASDIVPTGSVTHLVLGCPDAPSPVLTHAVELLLGRAAALKTDMDEVAGSDKCTDERLAGNLLGLGIVAVAEGVAARAREEGVDAVLGVADAIWESRDGGGQ